jgi:TolB-like protein/Tfp pilus assembly protein PilF
VSFFEELRRRSVFRVGAAYAIVAWLLIQVAGATFPQLQLPEWAPRLVTVLLLVGFPVALVLAWAFELTPEGIKLTQGERGAATAARARGGAVDYALIAGLVVVAAVTLWNPFAAETDRAAPAAEAFGPSIAVLPFADMSASGDQAYFGDGIAEELLNELTRLGGLRVAGRTSSFVYKGNNQNLRAIGEALGVATILEGSIRKDGDRIRITAQLVSSADGYHLWSETYDRDLEDIFAIQEEIAAAVAGELGVRLGVGGVNTFKGAGTRNVEAYEAYLQGANSGLNLAAAQRLLDRAIELDPNYAAAWSQRGLATLSMVWTGLPEEMPGILDRALYFVRRAVELDPTSAQVHSLYGTVQYARLDWIAGHESHARALSLLADRATLGQHGNLLLRTGRIEAARAQFDAAEAAEPMGGRPHELRIWQVLAQGRFAEAQALLPWQAEATRPAYEFDIAINARDPERVKSALAARPGIPVAASELHASVLAQFDSHDAVLATLRAAYADGAQWPAELHEIAMLAAYFGDPELALEAKGTETRSAPVRLFAVWYPVMADVRALPEFKELVADLNLVEYWRAYGWSDFCAPLGDTDFNCS